MILLYFEKPSKQAVIIFYFIDTLKEIFLNGALFSRCSRKESILNFFKLRKSDKANVL